MKHYLTTPLGNNSFGSSDCSVREGPLLGEDLIGLLPCCGWLCFNSPPQPAYLPTCLSFWLYCPLSHHSQLTLTVFLISLCHRFFYIYAHKSVDSKTQDTQHNKSLSNTPSFHTLTPSHSAVSLFSFYSQQWCWQRSCLKGTGQQ